MNSIYQQALNGTLRSSMDGTPMDNATFVNALPIPIYGFWVSPSGELIGLTTNNTPSGPPSVIGPGGGSLTVGLTYAGDYYAFVSSCSGGFLCVIRVFSQFSTIHSGLLTTPNDIGELPAPNSSTVIPCDSPLVVVAAGIVPNGNPVTREQYWHQGTSSYMLAPGQTNTVSYTATSGMQQTSSQQQSIATSLGVDGSGGWGPFSASVSASLNTESTTFQQFTASTEMTQSHSTVLTNSTEQPQMFLNWQLMDIVTVYTTGIQQTPLASMVNAQSPSLIAGPYNPTTLPPPPQRPALTDEMMAKLPGSLRRPPTQKWQ